MINSAWIRPLPLAASDLIVQDVLDQVPQDTAERSDLEFLTMSLDRPAIMESQFEISRVEDVEKHRDVFAIHRLLFQQSYVYHRESANSPIAEYTLSHTCTALVMPCLGPGDPLPWPSLVSYFPRAENTNYAQEFPPDISTLRNSRDSHGETEFGR